MRYIICNLCSGRGSVKASMDKSDAATVVDGEDPRSYYKCYACDGEGKIFETVAHSGK